MKLPSVVRMPKAKGKPNKATIPQQPQVSIHSLLAIVPAPHLCSAIDRIRQDHDKGWGKWPSHISLLHPFVPHFSSELAAAKVEAIVSRLEPFPLSFSSAVPLETGKAKDGRVYVCLQLDDQASQTITSLQQELLAVFPGCEAHKMPHMTLGQWPSRAEAMQACNQINEGQTVDGIEFVVEDVQIVVRKNDSSVGKPSHVIHLGDAEGSEAECSK